MRHDIGELALIGPMHQLGDQDQVARGGDRQELRDPLHYGKHDDLLYGHSPVARLFAARAGSIRGSSLARFILQCLAAQRFNGDAAALSALCLFPVDSACPRRVRGRGRARRGAALGVAPGVRRAEPGRNAAGFDHRRAGPGGRRLCHLRISERYRGRARCPAVPAVPGRASGASRGAAADRLVPPQVPRGGHVLSRRREGVPAVRAAKRLAQHGGDAGRARESALSSRLYRPSRRDAELARAAMP